MLNLKFPQMIDVETLENTSDEQLKSLCEELWSDIGLIKDELRCREMNKYNYEGRYIKYYGCNGDGTTYMYNRLPNLFNEMIERDEEPQQDENNE